MTLLDMIAGAQNGEALDNLGGQFGLDRSQAQAAVSTLAPVLAAGIRRNAEQGEGAADLLRALNSGTHDRYLDDAAAVQSDAGVEGNSILGHIFGSKDVSRSVAERASAQTGIGQQLLKQMLPVIASMVMGSLAKQASSPGARDIVGDILGGGQSPSGGVLGTVLDGVLKGAVSRGGRDSSSPGAMDIFGKLLDSDNDGSAFDDILEMAAKALR